MSEWAETPGTLPEDIVARFRLIALERLAHLEAGWAKLVADPKNPEIVTMIHREVHTLKGDARMVGFTDVDLVCHKLEDLLELARELDYAINDELDLVVSMAVRFIGMLLRKRIGAALGGIDLPGFVRQIDAVIAEAQITKHAPPTRSRVITGGPKFEVPSGDAIIGLARDRLAMTAVEQFLELHAGTSVSRRIERAWIALRDLLATPDPVPIAPQLARHEAGARELARELGKVVELKFELCASLALPAVVAALDVAVLHLVRNAIDHGVEEPAVREAAGKHARAEVLVRCALANGAVVLEVSDDGHGIDFPRVRSRGIALGLLNEDAMVSDEELAVLLVQPGFTTRVTATDISGRGIGLDAVKSTIDGVGGKLSVQSRAGEGTRISATIPSPARRFFVRRFAVRDHVLPFAVSEDWTVDVVGRRTDAVDLVEELAIGSGVEQPVTLQLVRNGTTVYVGAAGAPTRGEAHVVVATPPEAPGDIVHIDGVAHLLLRPSQFAGPPGRVVILDDSDICRELVRFSLEPLGIEVVMLEDPAALPGTLAPRTIDLLLLDLSFRGMDVAKLVREVRALTPSTMIFLHSDRTPMELERIATTVRADGHLSKTLGAERFVSRVTKILRARRASR